MKLPRIGLVRSCESTRELARYVVGVGMGELRRQPDYETRWRGTRLLVADRFCPSSKTCNDRGAVKAKLGLAERTFTRDARGHVAYGDLNAAGNLAGLASSHSWWATEN